ncbi:MAG: hypothetical protein GYA12_13220, partial [Chloroflexi bacterium]|nr:hypothetical protein [Chloroflexota bacterium]
MKNVKIKLPLFPITGVLIAVSMLLSAFSAAAPVQVPAPNESTGEVQQEAGPGEIVLDEKFVDNSNKWDFSTNEYSESVIEDGKLKVRVTGNGKFSHIKPPVDAEDVDISADAQFAKGDSMQYGFLCHYTDKDNYIQAVASTKGSFTIIKKIKSEFSDLVTWNPSNSINKGPDAMNHLRLICGGGHITFYINDTLAADVVDSSLSGGSYRLVAGWPKSDSENSVPVEMNFSNLVVRKPLAWEPSTDFVFSDTFDSKDKAWGLGENDGYTIQLLDGKKV